MIMQHKSTVIYKTFNGDTPIIFDAFMSQDALDSTKDGSKVPAVVYFHGGGLVCGNREGLFPNWLLERVLDLGFIFISADHQLMPPATGHDILKDAQDLFIFIKKERIVVSGKPISVDSDKIAAAGSSAGGLIAYLAGIHCSPRPKAIFSCFAMGGDMLLPSYFTPKTKPFFMGRPLQDTASFSDFLYPFKEGKLSRIADSPVGFNPPTHERPGAPISRRQMVVSVYLQLGTWLDYYTGAHEPSISQTLLQASELGIDSIELGNLIPSEHRVLFPQLGVNELFPPTLMLHGTKDTAVVINESQNLKTTLQKVNVPVEVIEVEGQEHFFDIAPNSAGTYEEEFNRVKEFLGKQLTS